MNGMATWGDRGRYEGKDDDSVQQSERLRFSIREMKRRPVDSEDTKRYDEEDGCGVESRHAGDGRETRFGNATAPADSSE